jgi:peptidoglycan/LPS O-acetylase OafA/YrhL
MMQGGAGAVTCDGGAGACADDPRMEAAPPSRHRDIDALRGLAAVSVVAFHAHAETASGGGLFTRVLGELDLGVVLFFVLSGYLVGGPFVRALLGGGRLPGVRAYALRRAARILPGYWMVLGAALCIGGVSLATAPSLGLHAVLLQGLVPGETFGWIDLSWTLSVEVLFYLFVPLAAVAWSRWRAGSVGHAGHVPVALAGLWVVSAGLGLAVATVGGEAPAALLVTRGLPGCLALFVPGMFVASLQETGLLQRAVGTRSRSWGLLAAAAASLLAAGFLHGTGTGAAGYVARNLLAGLGFGMVLAAVIGLRAAGRPARAWLRVAAAVGAVSYSIYLWHWLVGQLLELGGWSFGAGRGSAVAGLATLVVLFSATLPLAVASWFLVERPVMRAAAARIARDRSARRGRDMSLVGSSLPS